MTRYEFLASLPRDREILRQTSVTLPRFTGGWFTLHLEYPGMEVNESRWPGYSELYRTQNLHRAWIVRERFERWLNGAKRYAGVEQGADQKEETR